MKGDTIFSVVGHKTHLIIGEGHLKRVTGFYGPMNCHNCSKKILPDTEVVIRARGHALTYKIYCGACAWKIGLL